MKNSWNQIPALRFLLPLVGGITYSIVNDASNLPSLYYMIACSFVAAIFFWKLNFVKSFLIYYLQTVLLFIALFFAGIQLVKIHTPANYKSFYGHFLTPESVLHCRIILPPEFNEKTIKVSVEVNSIWLNSNLVDCRGKALLYIKNDTHQILNLNYGDEILISNHLKQPNAPKNPNEFNYQRYLKNNGIYYTGYLVANEITKTGNNTINYFWQFIFNSRAYFERSMKKYMHNEDAESVGLALILGDKTLLGDDIKQVYSNTGTTHILAVSGLHIAIFFVILDWLFNLFKVFKSKKGFFKYAKPILIIAIIWIYACITGLSPSVFRAAVMFSFLTLGKLEGQKINSYNLLGASALFLLLINPYMLTQVGFQLSYLAIFGIIAFQPKCAKLWKPKHKIFKYIWSLLTVSLAAQIGTVPVTLYYFHQFPNYFLLSNIFAIPISFVVLLAGVIFFAFSWIHILGICTGFILECSVRLLNLSVIGIDDIPGALTTNIHWTIWQTIVMYIVLLFAGFYLYTKQSWHFIATLFFILLFFCIRIIDLRQSYLQKSITFYSVPKQSFIAYSHCNQTVILTDNNIIQNTLFKFHVEQSLIHSNQHLRYSLPITENRISVNNFNMSLENHYLLIDSTLILLIDTTTQIKNLAHHNHVDYIYIRTNPFLDLNLIGELFPNAAYIFDGTNSTKSIQYWESYCIKNKLLYYNLKKDGALKIIF